LPDDGNTKSLLRRIFPKIVRAAIKGVIWFVFLYVLPTLIFSFLVSILPEGAPNIFSFYQQLFVVFAAIVVFFVVAGELTSGTIFQHMFNIGKALILIVFIVLALEGGVIEIDLQNIHILADLTIYLVMLLTIDFIGLAKSVLQAISFLSEKAENELPAPSPQ